LMAVGVLGVRSTSTLAPCAILASASSTVYLVSTMLSGSCAHFQLFSDEAFSVWRSLVPVDTESPLGTAAHRQKSWDSAVCLTIADSLLHSQSDSADQARLLAIRSPGAGLWLEAFPLASMGLHLDNESIRIAFALRLGAPIGLEHVLY